VIENFMNIISARRRFVAHFHWMTGAGILYLENMPQAAVFSTMLLSEPFHCKQCKFYDHLEKLDAAALTRSV
jgi:hypothetical protein